ncbi:hypothetical protein GE061_015660 [Apolygus lucorum]|uniref:Uncharacterized protein n=1 Tax=Apolygus lucorum TaxID=248454 RepID=A0A6A4JJX2_APOLU|nr:hypothetical protein GE061_015660 [Apolygus lucorum]
MKRMMYVSIIYLAGSLFVQVGGIPVKMLPAENNQLERAGYNAAQTEEMVTYEDWSALRAKVWIDMGETVKEVAAVTENTIATPSVNTTTVNETVLTTRNTFNERILTETINSTKHSSTRRQQSDTDDGGGDDSPRIFDFYETKPPLEIPPVHSLTELAVPDDWDDNTVAPKWILERMSTLQGAVVQLRKSYEKIMRDHAAWSCRWMEVHFPDYFACVTKNYIDLVVDDYRDYPKGLLLTIKEKKEMYMKSYANNIPLTKLDPDALKRTEFNVNGLIPAIENHRKELEELAVDKLRAQASSVRVICRLPPADRHPMDNTSDPDPLYVFEDDYSPVAYNRI